MSWTTRRAECSSELCQATWSLVRHPSSASTMGMGTSMVCPWFPCPSRHPHSWSPSTHKLVSDCLPCICPLCGRGFTYQILLTSFTIYGPAISHCHSTNIITTLYGITWGKINPKSKNLQSPQDNMISLASTSFQWLTFLITKG